MKIAFKYRKVNLLMPKINRAIKKLNKGRPLMSTLPGTNPKRDETLFLKIKQKNF